MWRRASLVALLVALCGVTPAWAGPTTTPSGGPTTGAVGSSPPGTHPIAAGDYAADSLDIDAILEVGNSSTNPALGDGEVWFPNEGGLIFEGSTADDIEGDLFAGTLDTNDKTWRLPNVSGVVVVVCGDGLTGTSGTCDMDGSFVWPDNVAATFGTTNKGTILHDGTNLFINPQSVGSGFTDFTDAIFVAEGEDVFSRFGPSPVIITTSDGRDTLVVNKLRTTNSNTLRRGLFAVGEVNSSLAMTNGQTFGFNSTAATNDTFTVSSTRTSNGGGFVAGRSVVQHKSAGTIAQAGSVTGHVLISGAIEDGVITTAYMFLDEGGDGGAGSGSIGTYNGVWIKDGIGNITTKLGVYVEDLTIGTDTSIGIQIDGAEKYVLWLGAGADNTDAVNGITFGSSADVNLYRSAANTLKTDDTFVSAGSIIGTTDPADTGVIRLENAASICWEASPAGTDNCITVDSSERFQFSGSGGGDITTIGTDDGAGPGPFLRLVRNSASPAASDQLGRINFDSAGNQTYARLDATILDPTGSSEDGSFDIITVVAGSMGDRFHVAQGFYSDGVTGGDKGTGTINASAVYDDGSQLATLASPTFTGNITVEDVLFLKETTTPTAVPDFGALYTKSTNDLFFIDGSGHEHLIHGPAFSNIWFHGTVEDEVEIATQDAFILIDSFTVVGQEDDFSKVVGSASNDNLTLSSIAGGDYQIEFHISLTQSAGADKQMTLNIGITLDTPKDITNVTDNTVSPIVITSTAHGFEDGEMLQIAGVLVNTAANGSFVVANKTANTFEIVALDSTATTGNGDYDEGTPTGDITIEYPGNMVVHKEVRKDILGAVSASAIHELANSDVVALYVANLESLDSLKVEAVSLSIFRLGN